MELDRRYFHHVYLDQTQTSQWNCRSPLECLGLVYLCEVISNSVSQSPFKTKAREMSIRQQRIYVYNVSYIAAKRVRNLLVQWTAGIILGFDTTYLHWCGKWRLHLYLLYEAALPKCDLKAYIYSTQCCIKRHQSPIWLYLLQYPLAGKFSKICVSFENGEYRVYFNGQLITIVTGRPPSPYTNSQSATSLGSMYNYPSFDGYIDDVRSWSWFL